MNASSYFELFWSFNVFLCLFTDLFDISRSDSDQQWNKYYYWWILYWIKMSSRGVPERITWFFNGPFCITSTFTFGTLNIFGAHTSVLHVMQDFYFKPLLVTKLSIFFVSSQVFCSHWLPAWITWPSSVVQVMCVCVCVCSALWEGFWGQTLSFLYESAFRSQSVTFICLNHFM